MIGVGRGDALEANVLRTVCDTHASFCLQPLESCLEGVKNNRHVRALLDPGVKCFVGSTPDV